MTNKIEDTKGKPIALHDVIMQVATEFINCQTEDFERVLNESFALVGTFLDVDRVYTFDYDFDNGWIDNTHEWCNEGISAEIDNLKKLPIELYFDDWIKNHMEGLEVNIPDVSKLDPKSVVYQTLAPQGIQSILTIPFKFGDLLLGFVGFDDNRHTRVWKDEEFKLLRILAEMITNVLIRLRNEQVIIDMREQAIKASQAKGQFLANVSHEIRTPLSGIYNAIYLLQTTNMTIEQKQYINIAQSSIETLAGIVDDVLDLSKIEAGKMDVFFDPFDLEDEIVKTMNIESFFAVDKNLSYTLDFDYSIDRMMIGDHQKIRQILLNLLSNAIKYTDEGAVHVAVRHVIDDDMDKVMLEVSDTGIGIDEEEMSHLFDMFYQVDSDISRRYPGTGLGLSIVEQLVTILGGTIDVKSTKGQGTTFKVILPMALGEKIRYQKASAIKAYCLDTPDCGGCEMLESMGVSIMRTWADEAVPDIIMISGKSGNLNQVKTLIDDHQDQQCLVMACSEGIRQHPKWVDLVIKAPVSRRMLHEQMMHAIQSTKNRKKTHSNSADQSYVGDILVVDDNRLNRLALGVILKKHGFRSKEAESGEEAIKMIKEQHFDVVLMDIQMPGKDGYETTRTIREISPKYQHLPIVAVTANVFADDNKSYQASGMNDIVFKPIKVEQMLSVIHKYVERAFLIVIPRHLRIFNKPEFDSRFEGSDGIGRDVIETFLAEYKTDLDNIRISVEDKKAEEIEKTAHYFKGSISYVSGERVLWVLSNMIEKARERRLEYIETYYEKLELEVYELVRKLQVDLL